MDILNRQQVKDLVRQELIRKYQVTIESVNALIADYIKQRPGEPPYAYYKFIWETPRLSDLERDFKILFEGIDYTLSHSDTAKFDKSTEESSIILLELTVRYRL